MLVLLDHGVQVRLHDWFRSLGQEFWVSAWKHEKDLFPRVWYDMAVSLLHRRDSPRDDIGDVEASKKVENTATPSDSSIYHVTHRSYIQFDLMKIALESAWAAGHSEIDTLSERIPELRWMSEFANIGTPLWTSAIEMSHHTFWRNSWFVQKWLLDHGAKPSWTHPVFHTTPSNIIAYRAVRCAIEGQTLAPLIDMKSLLESSAPDQCVCHCGQGGCHAIGCAVSTSAAFSHVSHQGKLRLGRKVRLESKWWREEESYLSLKREFYSGTILPWLFDLVDDDQNANGMHSIILRALSFEKLSLTHTCCYRIIDEIDENESFTRPTPEEAKVIHNLEQTEIELLDDLMEEFEASWAQYHKAFAKFIRRVWKSRMEKVRRERQVDKKLYKTEMRRLGIIVNDSDEGEIESGSEVESDVSEQSVISEGSEWHTTDDEGGINDEEDYGVSRL
jgi:hypothetical protein